MGELASFINAKGFLDPKMVAEDTQSRESERGGRVRVSVSVKVRARVRVRVKVRVRARARARVQV